MATRLKLAIAAFMAGTLFAEPHWLRLKSANFEMYTSAGERNAQETLRYFEQVRAFFAQGMGNLPGKQLPVRIVAFGSKKEYEPYRFNNFASAYYHSTDTTEEIVLSEIGPDVFRVAVHEYVHLVVKHMGLKLPPWLNEGMAELYSTLKPMGDRVLVGTLIEGRFQALQNDKWVPLHIIVNVDQSSPYYNEKDKAGSLYNEGWALTHMLVLTNEYRPGFEKFMKMVSDGTPTEEALQKIYGKTIEQVEKDLKTYLRGTHFQGAYFAQKLQPSSSEITVEPALDFDVKLVEASLLDRSGNEDDVRKALEQLAAENPKRPEPFVALGYLARRTGDRAGAQKNFSMAFELGVKNPTMLWDYALMLRGRDQDKAIAVLSELVKEQPSRNDVRLELAAEQLTAQHPGQALDTLRLMQKVSQEEAPRMFGIIAHAQLDLRQWSDARQSAERLKAVARTDEEKYQADRILKYLDAREKPGASPELAPPAENESGRPTLRHKASPESPAEAPRNPKQSVAGTFNFLDCSGPSVKIVIQGETGQKVFLIDDPHKVLGDTVDLTCGAQKTQDRVRVDYIPATQPGIDGLLRGFQREP